VGIGYIAERVDINTALITVGTAAAVLSLLALVRFKEIRELD
jgi:hypothetical protein